MAQQLSGTPVLVLKEGSERARGKDAQSRNILAASAEEQPPAGGGYPGMYPGMEGGY
jgi:hypothetical protein